MTLPGPPRPRLAAAAGLLLVPLLYLAVGLATLHDYGETSDEAYDLSIGRFYYEEYPLTGLSRLDGSLDGLQRNYGAFFDVVVVAAHDLLVNRLGWMTDDVAATHVPVLVVSSLLLGVVFAIGERAGGLGAGFASQGALLLMPQFVAFSQNNLKDQPVSFFFALSMLAFLVAWKRESIWLWALFGALGGVAWSVKVNAAFVLPVAALFALPFALAAPRRIPGLALRFAVAAAAYVAVVPLLWPYYRSHLPARFLETVHAFRTHEFDELVFYLGRHTSARQVPWHFPFVMLGVNTPLPQLLLALGGIGLLAALLVRRRLEESAPLLLFAVWLFLPIVGQLASGAPRCDGVRHYLYLLPALALLAGTAASRLWAFAEERALGPRALRVAVAAAPALLLVRTLVSLHPYQIAFFNRLAGGTAGARELFELDYGGTSLLAASRFIREALPAGTRLWFTQPGEHRFQIPRESYFFVEAEDRPNFKVSLPRGMVKTYDTDDDYLHPRRKPYWEVRAGGAPILQIFELEENRDLPDGSVLPPSPAPPAGLLPGLRTALSVDSAPLEEVAPAQRLHVSPSGPYRGRATDLRAAGFLRVDRAGPHVFELHSDDCATVWLGDGALMTNISTLTTRRTAVLSPGLYRFRLRYRNTVDVAELTLLWQPPLAPELTEIPAGAFFHAPLGEDPRKTAR